MKKLVQKLSTMLFVIAFAVGAFAQTTPTIAEGEQAVFFENTENWSGDIYAYLWAESGVIQWVGEWPGEVCTYLGNNIWKWTYSGEANIYGETTVYGGLIFNNKGVDNNGIGMQTADLEFVNGGYYNANGYVKTITPTGGEVVDSSLVAHPNVFVTSSYNGWIYEAMAFRDSVYTIEYVLDAGLHQFSLATEDLYGYYIWLDGCNVINTVGSTPGYGCLSNGAIYFVLADKAKVSISFDLRVNSLTLVADGLDKFVDYVPVYKSFVAGSFTDWLVRDTMTLYGDTVYSIEYEKMPAGSYEFKVVYGDEMLGRYWFGGEAIDSLGSTSGFECLEGGNISFTLNEEADVHISYNLRVGKITLYAEGISEFGEFVVEYYSICGSKAIFGEEFLTDAYREKIDDYKMIEKDGVYTKTLKSVALEVGENYRYKVAANGSWNEGQFPQSGDMIFGVGLSGLYDLTFTYIPDSAYLSVNPVLVESSVITKTIDYSMCDGDSIVFAGNTLFESGTYQAVFESSEGKDSLVILNLTVFPSYRQTYDVTIKEGESYSGYGFVGLTVAGEYVRPLLTADGCDSTIVLNLVVEEVELPMVVEFENISSIYEMGMWDMRYYESYSSNNVVAVLKSQPTVVDVVKTSGVFGRVINNYYLNDGTGVIVLQAEGDIINSIMDEETWEVIGYDTIPGLNIEVGKKLPADLMAYIDFKCIVDNEKFMPTGEVYGAPVMTYVAKATGDTIIDESGREIIETESNEAFVARCKNSDFEEEAVKVSIDSLLANRLAYAGKLLQFNEEANYYCVIEETAVSGGMISTAYMYWNAEEAFDVDKSGGETVLFPKMTEDWYNFVGKVFNVQGAYLPEATFEANEKIAVKQARFDWNSIAVGQSLHVLDYTIGSTSSTDPVKSYSIEYVLNGGVTNDYGWKNKGDMYSHLNTVWNEFSGDTIVWPALDSLADFTKGIPTQAAKMDLKFLEDSAFKADFGWLIAYMDYQCTEQEKTLPSTSAAFLRYNLAAFFSNTVRIGWPVSADYTLVGDISYFQRTWKAGFVNPKEYVEGNSVVLHAPYKEGYIFKGWYRNADFSGEKVTEISGIGDITLYAKWTEYTPTIAEVIALTDSTATKVQGTVTYSAGSNFWIQDETGGILCYGKNNGVTEGDYVVLSGEKVIYKNSPELNSAVVELIETGEEVKAQTVLLSSIYADSVRNYKTYLNELVYLEGVVISKYEDNGTYETPYITDGINEIALYKWDGITEDLYPIGTKVSVKAVLSIYNTTLQLRGKAEWVIPAAAVGKDSYEYENVRVGGVDYAFENNWMYSVNLGNWSDNRPNPLAEGSRSVVEKDGILYFSYRNGNTPTEQPRLVRVDAETGKMLEPVFFADYIFKDVNGNWLFGPYADLKLDNAGNAITSNLPTAGGPFQVWNVDLTTGAGKLIIDLATDTTKWLSAQFPSDGNVRLDRIGVYGDVNGDATIMSVVNSSSAEYNAALSWNIEDGKWDGETNWIPLDISWTGLSGSPTITPVGNGYFYVDAFTTYPFLFNSYGDKDGFTSEAGADHLTIGSKGVARSNGHNGVTEFEFNGERFLLIAGDNTLGYGTAPSTFVLYKFADENREFNKMTQMWEFPMDGMGSNSNPQRTASSFVRLSEDGSKVDIYVYTLENGYGHYTMSIAESGTDNNLKLHLRDGEQAVFFDNADLDGNAVWDGNINAYAWTYNDYYELEEYTNSWPGDPCLYVGNNIWKWTYEGGENISGNIIFNNSNYQTYDLNYVNGGLYNSADYQYKVKPIGTDKVSVWIGTWNSRGGEVYGSGVYNVGDTIVAKAEANKGYVFTKWSDGSVENPRMLIAGEDTTLVAYFDMEYLVIHVEVPGTLGDEALELVEDLTDILAVKITGTLNDEDVTLIRTRMTNLKQLDISELNMQYLPDYMFEYSQIEKVVLPKGLTGIGRNAFYNCSNLTYVDMPDSLQTIGYMAFYYCTKLASVDLANSITTIDSYAFAGTALTNVVFPESLIALGSYVFSNCAQLTSVITNSQLVNINSHVFDECVRLKTVCLAEGLRYINQYAFADCDALSAIKFPSTLVSIDSYAFQYCAQLASVEFNEGLEEINDNAFRYCHSLRNAIYLPSSLITCKTSFGDYVHTIYSYAAIPPTMGNGYIYYCDTLYVPAMSLKEYKLANGYEVFQNILPMGDVLPEVITIHENTTLAVPDSLPADYKPTIKMTNSRGYDYFMPSLVLQGDSIMSLSYFDMWYSFSDDYYNNCWGSYNEYNLQKVPYYNSFVCDAPVRADQVAINMFLYDNVWNFVSLPFDVKVSDILMTANSMFVVRKYSGADRAATNFDATWQNMTKDSVLRAGEGYIWQSSHPENIYTQFMMYAQDNANKNNIFATTDRSVKLNEYLSEFEHNRSWNLIGNPYPTFFDIQSTDFTAPITVWNLYNQTYEAYSPIDDNYVLTPGEAFFVQKPINVDAITFYAEGRMTNTQVEAMANSNYAPRKQVNSSSREVFNLELFEDEASKDKTRFVLNEYANVNYEMSCDASKFITKGSDVAQIYTHENDVNFAINERPIDNGVVNIAVETSKAGQYTIALRTNSTRQAILVDKVAKTEIVLNQSEYTFDAEEGVVTDRFYIIFRSGTITDLNTSEVMLVDVYNNNGRIIVEATEEAQIEVYTVSGILVAATTATNASFDVEAGVYVVMVNDNVYKVAVTK